MTDQTVSHYKILEKIGAGGMGVVYKAQDTRLDRTVALKFLPEHLLNDAAAKARFIHEAKGASAINHPNITTVYDIDEAEGKCFIAMEYLEGKTVKALVKENPKLDEALGIAIQLAEGLAAAHKKELVHRDIKPENIMLTKDGTVKIMDFGLAKLKGQANLTESDATPGTAAYMSPEQARGEETDPRSDLFSFGVVLYELVTGRLPFSGAHAAAVAYSICFEEPERLSGLPEGLQRILEKALKKNRELRYSSAAELQADLKALREGSLLPERSFRRVMLAVLPFENLGPPEQEHFADGITDEITTHLAKISELGVISRTSAMTYKNAKKPLPQIGRELKVDYVVEGTLRADTLAHPPRLRVSSQLIRVSDDSHEWAESYDIVVNDIFALQSKIAKKVASALKVTLLENERQALEHKPTMNVEAYQYYQRGNEYLHRGWDKRDYEAAAEMFSKAIQLDPGFALAYAHLSEAHSLLYWFSFDRTETRMNQAKAAVEQAFKLQPGLPEAHMALGSYYYRGFFDYDRAMQHYAIAQKRLPNSADLSTMVAAVQRRQGKFKEAIGNLKRAFELDPLTYGRSIEVGVTCCFIRRYREAESYFDEDISLAPERSAAHIAKAWSYVIGEGNVTKASQILEKASAKISSDKLAFPLAVLEMLDGNYQEAIEKLAKPIVFENYYLFLNDFPTCLLAKAKLYGLTNQENLKRDCYDSLRQLFEPQVRERPQDADNHTQLGLAYAGLGRKDEAVREGEKGVELHPVSVDAFTGPRRVQELAEILVMVGEYNAAMEKLEYLLSIPSWLSKPLVRLDPTWAPLRNHPRFKKLVAGKIKKGNHIGLPLQKNQ
ncbi:MAG: protein kinase [candidate division Zixibacteria bacterium]|nr:protein kinase [candidate division Zixibacteria bacterium]